jgi:hypothetical protein
VRRFTATERGASTGAFDRAIIDGQPIAREPVLGSPLRRRVLPLDLWIVDWPR